MARQLTEEFARKTPAPEIGQVFHFDNKLAGFALRISPRVRAWTMQLYRQGKSQRVTLGLVGELSLTDARAKAMALKAKGLKATRGQPQTVSDLWDKLVAEDEHRLRGRTKTLYDGYWRNHIEPAFGTQKLARITPDDVSKMLSKIPGNAHANRVYEITSRLFSYAEQHNWLSVNPANGWKRRHEAHRESYLDAGALTTLFNALPTTEVGDALRFAALSGARIGEVLGMRWSDLRDNGAIWSKPAASTKQKRQHIVPLSVEAMVIVDRQARRGEFVFAREDGSAIKNARRTWLWALKRSGLTGIRIHDLRHSLASAMINSGASLALVGAALGHSTPTTTQRYAHIASQTLREALDKANSGRNTNVIPIDRKKA